MTHLTVPLYCAGTTAFLFALLLRAIWTSAHTFVAVFFGALIFFAWRTFAETRKNLPAFRADLCRRSERRRREAQQSAATSRTDHVK